ncbi:MAG TPA: YggT family protein [Drouetiella sp.]
MAGIAQIVVGFIQLINLLVIVWCLLSWFPNIRWYDQPFKTLDRIVQPIIAPFRKLIPPIGNIDLSPMIALFVLQGIQMLVVRVLPY